MRELRYARSRSRAFTLIELVIIMTILGVIMSVALPAYENAKHKARMAQCKADIVMISQRLEKYRAFNYAYPDALSTLGAVDPDPWGNDYQYLNLDNYTDKGKLEKDKGKGGGGKPPKAPKPRKDKNLKPLNTDFDLFSMGPDGDYKENLSAKVSRDDCIRANDGTFIGLADDY
ncbi:MAG: prepilin-type N-terminal cleavage/methylation domain-containing protein [Halieaceae bacterium]